MPAPNFINTFKEFTDEKELKAVFENVLDYISKLIEQKKLGAKHRETFLMDIHHDIEKIKAGYKINNRKLNLGLLLKTLKMDSQEFADLVGNICNLQLVILRKYFNDISMKTEDRWDAERFLTIYRKWIVSWHCKKENEKKNQADLLYRLDKIKDNKKYDEVLLFLRKMQAKFTIPPYEDQKNRNIPKCCSLYLNPVKLDKIFPDWEKTIEKIMKNIIINADININDRLSSRVPKIKRDYIDTKLNRQERQQNAYRLQRVLDVNKKLDEFAIRDTVHIYYHDSKKEICEKGIALQRVLGDDLFDKFINFAYEYYFAIEGARQGIWDNPHNDIDKARDNLFWICNMNPPHKNKISHELINNLLGINLNSESWDRETGKAYKFWSEGTELIVGRIKSYKNLAKKFEEMRKLYGNRFKNVLEEAKKLKQEKVKEKDIDKDLLSIINYFDANPSLYENFIKGIAEKEISHTKDMSAVYIFSLRCIIF